MNHKKAVLRADKNNRKEEPIKIMYSYIGTRMEGRVNRPSFSVFLKSGVIVIAL